MFKAKDRVEILDTAYWYQCETGTVISISRFGNGETCVLVNIDGQASHGKGFLVNELKLIED